MVFGDRPTFEEVLLLQIFLGILHDGMPTEIIISSAVSVRDGTFSITYWLSAGGARLCQSTLETSQWWVPNRRSYSSIVASLKHMKHGSYGSVGHLDIMRQARSASIEGRLLYI